MTANAIAVCASGPSLCKADVQRLCDHEIPVITINSSWAIYPECQYIFSGDEAWWNDNYDLITSPAQKWTCSESAAQKYKIHYFDKETEEALNTGIVAILFAISLGVENIILLGYDCSLEKGVHWHGKHPRLNNPTSYSVRRWKTEFESYSIDIRRRVNIVNCSHESRLSCFPKASLEETLRRVKR
ncbi:hypothetical protein ACLECX_06885 [Lonsdalea quercina]|uniref:hypothetical protein n=1 Tax=Lonsdalea quercina TaxID=71657 RepID=UPI003976BF33